MTMGLFNKDFIAHFAVYLLFIGNNYAVLGQDAIPAILNLSARGEVGGAAQLTCSLTPENATVIWKFKGEPLPASHRITHTNESRAHPEKDLDGNLRKYRVANLTVANASAADAGEYTCSSASGERADERTVTLDLAFPGRLVRQTLGPVLANATDNVEVKLLCIFEVYKPAEVKWWKKGKDEDNTLLETKPLTPINMKQYESTHAFTVKRPEDNGTYLCETLDSVTRTNITGEVNVMVYAAPKVIIDTVKPISSSQLYLNWTIHAHNLPVRGYNLMYRRLPSSDYNLYIREKIGVKNTSFVVEGLDNSTEYQLKLEVTTAYGSSSYVHHQTVATLAKDPIFVPNISINGFSATSVTIGWAPPSEDIAEYIHYYLLEARKKGEHAPKRAYHSRDSRNLPYMFDDLEAHTTYIFRVCACSDYTGRCGDWSLEMEAVTMDGAPGRPSNMTVACYAAGEARRMNLTWQPPVKPNAVIKGYNITLTGNATYRDRFGYEKLDSIGPLSKFVTNSSTSVLFEKLEPNTYYTVQLSAMSRSRRRGEEETRHCRTAPAPPDHPARPHWRKIVENEKYMFKMFIPRVSERNGPICCYRVYLVRLPPALDWAQLPPPRELPVLTYERAHAAPPAPRPLGAYATDVFSNDKFPPDSELVMGDGKTMLANGVCPRCQKKPKRPEPPQPKTSSVPTTTREEDYDLFEGDTTLEPLVEDKRERRSYGLREPYYLMSNEYSRNPMMMDSPGPASAAEPDDNLDIRDGPLDAGSNYTLFVELIPGVESDEPMYSDYLNALSPAPTPPAPRPVNVLEIVLQITCGLLALVLLGMVAFCALHSRRARKPPPHAHVEMNPIQAALRYVEHVLSGRAAAGGAAPVEPPPIAREDLAAAYAERQADSDYGFQKEFEMLPDSFPDRTTHASESRENQPKNRYPDIKAYDQTRVKLSQVDGVVGSDYINANYVMGYKERKQYICAQGPTEATVNDFWRMIWEHGLELVVMLTNLEEYSKVKCSKYWPDDVRSSRAFGAVSVQHVAERRYSDYIVRELRITKLPVSDDGQPIVENGVKRNGDVKDPSAPSSPQGKEPNGTMPYERIVRQYHFLQWKDFAAPEHASSILKFIKRINTAWSSMSCRPALVHCSAGVGRTGTLVALDSLTQQLAAEGHARVFACVAELRRQRCCLVQSLKQYIFVYRALVEFAHYGDTEIAAPRLKTALDTLRNTPEGADKCLMEHEFEKILSPPVTEGVKSVSAGASAALRGKNRSAACLPYDRNRVILTPVPGRDFSTYINASFIEAYDNTEGYIITQDPLPGTIGDFWRMVCEHGVHTIVMLSELGEGERKCPRYWDDDTAQYDHLTVQYEQSEPCPYYTRRQFSVVNNKNGEATSVRQLQYHGWPTAEGHVPEVTRGLAELADAAAPPAGISGPTLVHCHLGGERSSMFVSLCILICQLRAERRVDVNCVARKVRAQRANALDTFLQYEFLHRAILNYAELHNLMDDS